VDPKYVSKMARKSVLLLTPFCFAVRSICFKRLGSTEKDTLRIGAALLMRGLPTDFFLAGMGGFLSVGFFTISVVSCAKTKTFVAFA
jgi:hypothetical protein